MTAPAFLDPAHRRLYAEAARFERHDRARIYREKAKAEGRDCVEALAEADWLAWRAIAHWCAGEPIAWEIGRADEAGANPPRASNLALMEQAAALALQTCEAAAAKRPADPEPARRRDQVAEILSMLQRTRAWLDTLNRDLRRQAGRAEAA